MCGEQIKLSSARSGLSGFTGSSSNTSNAAAATFFDLSASHKSPSCTMPPRAQLAIITPGFILAMACALMSALVSGVSGVCTEITSARRNSSSSSTMVTPIF